MIQCPKYPIHSVIIKEMIDNNMSLIELVKNSDKVFLNRDDKHHIITTIKHLIGWKPLDSGLKAATL